VGVVVQGKALSGRNAIAGEWGHNPLPWAEPEEQPGGRFCRRCYCGRDGCIETFLSGPNLAVDHRMVTGETLDAHAIARRATEGDVGAGQTMARYTDRLARGLASVINVIDPDVIVLGGGLSNINALYEATPGRWGRYGFTDRLDTALVPPKHGDSSGRARGGLAVAQGDGGMTWLCRDCGAGDTAEDKPARCPACGSPRLVAHAELDRLSIAHIDCDASTPRSRNAAGPS